MRGSKLVVPALATVLAIVSINASVAQAISPKNPEYVSSHGTLPLSIAGKQLNNQVLEGSGHKIECTGLTIKGELLSSGKGDETFTYKGCSDVNHVKCDVLGPGKPNGTFEVKFESLLAYYSKAAAAAHNVGSSEGGTLLVPEAGGFFTIDLEKTGSGSFASECGNGSKTNEIFGSVLVKNVEGVQPDEKVAHDFEGKGDQIYWRNILTEPLLIEEPEERKTSLEGFGGPLKYTGKLEISSSNNTTEWGMKG